MKFWTRATKVFGYIWLGSAGLLIFVCMVSIWMESGFSKVMEILNPFNFWNLIAVVITLSPGAGFLYLSEKLESKIQD